MPTLCMATALTCGFEESVEQVFDALWSLDHGMSCKALWSGAKCHRLAFIGTGAHYGEQLSR